MSIFDQINEQLPLTISGVNWSGEVLTLSGENWNLSTLSAWRIRDEERMQTGCFDPKAEAVLQGLVGRSVIRVEPQSADFAIDPRLVFDQGLMLEIFSSDTFEPWKLELPVPPILVAAPADTHWIRAITQRGDPARGRR
jgi:hypothetical protein